MPAILKITDGTNSVNLIHNAHETGFFLTEWTPQAADHKGGGVYRESPLAHGKRLILKRWDTTIETFDVKVRGSSQDNLILETRRLRQLLEKASDYWTTPWANEPVWIECKASKESNTRYAPIIRARLVSDDNPFGMPFLQPECYSVMDELQLVVERGHWMANPPKSSECVELTAADTWQIESEWALNTSDPVGNIQCFVETSNGDIFAGDDGQILTSDDDGATWSVATTDPVGYICAMFVDSNDNIYAGDANGDLWQSTDGGGTWASVLSEAIVGIDQDPNGYLWAVSGTEIFRSTDGSSWSSIKAIDAAYQNATCVLCMSNGHIMVGANNRLYRAINSNPSYWYSSPIPLTVAGLIELSNGDVYAYGHYGIYRVSDAQPGNYFMRCDLIYQYINSIKQMIQADSGRLYAAFSPVVNYGVYYSDNLGYTWRLDSNIDPLSIFQSSTGSLYAGLSGHNFAIYKKPAPTEVTLGREDNCTGAYVVNKSCKANLTHIFINDGGIYSANLVPNTLPLTLFPETPAEGDAIIFGISSSYLNYGPFSNLVFNIDQIAAGATTYAITWSYSKSDDPDGWCDFTAVKDNTEGFTVAGVNSVTWAVPADWSLATVNSVEAYWVKAQITTLTGTLVPPTQDDDDIYATTWPSVLIEDDYIKGDIPSNIKIEVINRSDEDGPGGDAPDLYSNKIVCGLRSIDRGTNFNAYLNASDEQVPFGITTTAGTNCTFQDVSTTQAVVQYPTAVRLVYDPNGVETMANRMTWSLATTIARDYYGIYHAFLRAQQSGGTVGDIGVRLYVTTGTGGISWASDTKYFTTTNAWQLIDLGRVTLPVSGLIQYDEITDSTDISIQASSISGTPYLYLCDLILIPTDEWAGEFIDTVNTASSALMGGYTLEIDSVTNPKQSITAKTKTPTGMVASIWQSNANGPAILQSNANQRLWFFSAKTASAGSTEWVSNPEMLHEIKVYKNEQYLGLRGNG